MKGEHGKVVGSPPLSLAYTSYTNSVSELFKHIVSHRSLHSPFCSISFPSPLAAGEAHHELRLTGRSVGVYLLSFFFLFSFLYGWYFLIVIVIVMIFLRVPAAAQFVPSCVWLIDMTITREKCTSRGDDLRSLTDV